MKNLILCLLSLYLFAGCKTDTASRINEKLTIVTTTQMIADVVKNIAGDKAEVVSLMGPGIDPHFYKATQGDLVKLNKADVIFYNGLHLEGKMQDVFESYAKQKNVVAVSAAIPRENLIISSHQGNEIIYDPHIWHAVDLWLYTPKTIANTLAQVDSVNADFYRRKELVYKEKMKVVHKRIALKIDSIPPQQRLLITSHDAFHYYGRTYDIEFKGLQGISTVSEIGLKDITAMVELIISRKVKAVFVESSVNEKNLKAVIEGCKQKGHQVTIGGTLYSDAMGAENTAEGTYLGMIQYNTQKILEALR